MEARTARSRRTREALVDAVLAELRDSGSFTAGPVAARAGCSAATFYAHFPTKDDALAEAFGAVLDELVDRSASRFAVGPGIVHPLTGTRGPTRFWLDVVDDLVEFFGREHLVFRSALARLPEHRPLRQSYRRAERHMLEVLRRFVVAGQADGVVPCGDPDQLATTLLVVAQGCNNPRLLRAPAAVRTGIARAMAAVISSGVATS